MREGVPNTDVTRSILCFSSNPVPFIPYFLPQRTKSNCRRKGEEGESEKMSNTLLQQCDDHTFLQQRLLNQF
jgi:hypothetical protein